MTTQEIIDGYTSAWTSGDMVATRAFLADDLDFEGSLETHHSAESFIPGLTMFREHLFAGHSELQRVVEGDSGFLLYDCKLNTGATLRCAEFFETAGGKITRIRLVFDTSRMPKT